MSGCGQSFRTGEDYRDHLPCEKCDPVEEANRSAARRWMGLRDPGVEANEMAHEHVRKTMEAPRRRPTSADRSLERAHLIALLERARPFISTERELFDGSWKERTDHADQLLKDIDDAIRS